MSSDWLEAAFFSSRGVRQDLSHSPEPAVSSRNLNHFSVSGSTLKGHSGRMSIFYEDQHEHVVKQCDLHRVTFPPHPWLRCRDMRDGRELTAGMKHSLFIQPQKMALMLTGDLGQKSKLIGSVGSYSKGDVWMIHSEDINNVKERQKERRCKKLLKKKITGNKTEKERKAFLKLLIGGLL